jgi:hypothetical protein
MSDYGIKVSRTGFPVETAADNQLLYSSSFPTLSVIQEGTVGAGGSVSHALGYFPVFSYQSYFTSNSAFGGGKVSVDDSFVYNGGTQTVRYRLYNRNIRTNETGKNVITTPVTQGSVSQDYGFKVSKDGVDVGTADLNNLTSFSGASLAGFAVRQLIVHQTGFTDNISNGVTGTYSHNLGYAGQLWTYIRSHADTAYTFDEMIFTVSAGPTLTIAYQSTTDSGNVYAYNNLGSAIDFAYILFKDPI